MLFKDLGEIILGGKTQGQGDFLNRTVRAVQKLSSALHLGHLNQIDRRHTENFLEQLIDRGGRQAGKGRQVIDVDGLCHILIDILNTAVDCRVFFRGQLYLPIAPHQLC